MKKSLLKAIVIIVSLLMIIGCPDPVNVQTPVTPEEPAGGGTPANTPANTATSVNYTVKHMKQDVSSDGYTEDTSSRQTLSGAPGATTAAQAKSYTGFTAQTFSQATIAADGSTVVTINYNRNVYSVSYSATTSGVTAPETASYRYGAQVTVTFPTGITAWQGNNTIYTVTNNTFSMPDTNLNLSEYSFNPTTMASTLETLPANDVDTPYTITLSGNINLNTIKTAIKNSEVYVTLSLEHCASLTSLPNKAFQGCNKITNISIPSSVTSIGNYAFESCTSLESIDIPSSVTSIGNYAFESCTSLERINVSSDNNNYSSVDGVLLNKNCTTLLCFPGGKTSVSFPSSVTSIGSYAFYGCTGLESITIPSSVTSIGSNAFKSCTNLESIEIPSSVTSIGIGAFERCTNLRNISIPSSVTSIGNYAFKSCTNLETINVSSDNNNYSSVDGVLLNKNCTTLLCFPGGKTSVSLPSSVTSIGNYAFSGYSRLQSISIPSSITSIGEGAFSYCSSLESITIPYSVTSIGDYAFSRCESLESITIPSSVTSIGNTVFSGCDKLESITIPSSVTSIGSYAFSRCSALQTITFQGTTTQWNSISKGNGWKDNCPRSMQVVCTDGTTTP